MEIPPSLILFLDTNKYPSIKFLVIENCFCILLARKLLPKMMNEVIMYNSKIPMENSNPRTLLNPKRIKKMLNNPTIHKSIIFSATKLPTRKLNFILVELLDNSFALAKSPALNGSILFKKYPIWVVEIYFCNSRCFGESNKIFHLNDLRMNVTKVVINAAKI